MRDALEQHVLGEILDEGSLDAEFSPGERDLDLALGIVTTARASGTSDAAASTAVPPRLWPIRIAGAWPALRSAFAAATRSETLEENVVLANSPSLEPSPVKSNRSTAMPSAVRPSAMRLAACTSLPQVKQCANSA
jgi:hypothetical protein